jgi:multidrug resistance efflux pump
MLLSLLLFAGIAALLYQNFLYRYEIAGTVEGNYKKIYAQDEAIIDTIYVKSGQKVKKDTVLADLNGDKVLSQLKVLQSIKNARVKERKLQSSLKNSIHVVPLDREVLSLEKQAVDEYYSMLQNARVQFQNHLITNQELIDIKMKYQEVREGYALYKSQSSYPQSGTIQALQKVVNVEEVDLQMLEKKRLLEELRLFSPEDGIIYDVITQSGDRVGKNDPLLTLWIYKVPQIICVLSTYKASDLKIGSEVEIIDSIDGQEFTGIVKEIKNTSYEQDLKTPRLKSFSDVFIVIEPENNAIVLPPHSMVKVKFKRTFQF